jgi:hypothetical protein
MAFVGRSVKSEDTDSFISKTQTRESISLNFCFVANLLLHSFITCEVCSNLRSNHRRRSETSSTLKSSSARAGQLPTIALDSTIRRFSQFPCEPITTNNTHTLQPAADPINKQQWRIHVRLHQFQAMVPSHRQLLLQLHAVKWTP